VVELPRQGHTQLAIAERIGIDADTVSRWLNAGEFQERQIRSDRRRYQALFVQQPTRGAHHSPSLYPLLSRAYSSIVEHATENSFDGANQISVGVLAVLSESS
jgi:hypothetical protein